MGFWLIRPHDPLIVRDGRPFHADPGARATTLPFPYPTTLAGAARTLSAPTPWPRRFPDALIQELLRRSLRGPWLVAPDHQGRIARLYLPAPADALILQIPDADEAAALRLWLRPLSNPPGTQTNLPAALALVGPRRPRPNKVHPEAPAFWDWEHFRAWLIAPPDEQRIPDIRAWGLPPLPVEHRTHVRIAPDRQTAESGGLFVTSGLEFLHAPRRDGRVDWQAVQELALLIETDAQIAAPWGFLGGERRIAAWQPVAGNPLPSCPEEVREAILQTHHCRLILLTPACFEQGFLPARLGEQLGLKVQVKAAAVPRYRTVSGWDYHQRRPKPTRRLAPAGSVYFLQLEGNADAIQTFIQGVWMQNVSENDQDRRDGFGLAVLGTWDGSYVGMEVIHE